MYAHVDRIYMYFVYNVHIKEWCKRQIKILIYFQVHIHVDVAMDGAMYGWCHV